MRKFLTGLFGAVMVTLLLLTPAIIGGAIETHYFLEATVSAVFSDEIVVTDQNGEMWCFEGTGFSVNDEVTLLMDTNCTDKIKEDDKIIKVF